MIRAAGVLCIVDGLALFLRRTDGTWCFPGGRIEDGETAEQAARREFEEETGAPLKGELVEWTRRIRAEQVHVTVAQGVGESPSIVPSDLPAPEEVDFTTFLAKGVKPFDVKLNDEHVGYSWSALSAAPEPLHPGCRVSIDRISMNELDVAKAIIRGDLTSPQRFHNMWLFDMRITGTGTAWRPAHEEIAYRRPENYLTPEFLQRCNGLQVIWEHPKKAAVLNSKEFGDRTIGAMFVPYIGDGVRHPIDEVWGIAKVYDDDAAGEMNAGRLSTSPAVVIRKAASQTVPLDDGTVVLIEGDPFLLDHLAVCEVGVWDKGGEPTGVEAEIVTLRDSMTDATRNDAARADETKKDEAAERKDATRKDGEGKEVETKGDAAKLDAILDAIGSAGKRMDAMCERMDAFESKKDARKDADDDKKEEKKDEAKKDAAEPEKKGEEVKGDKRKDEDEERMDARADAAVSPIRGDLAKLSQTVADLAKRTPGHLSDTDIAELSSAQMRADSIFQAFGQSGPTPVPGEGPIGYRLRIATQLKAHSKSWSGADLGKIADPTAFGNVETAIYADAMHAAMHPADLKPGQLRMVTRVDATTGARINTFVGTNTFLKGTGPRRGVRDIRARKQS